MPRIARTVIPGIPHHVTQRGNNRQDVFFVEDDRTVYLHFLSRYAPQFGLDILGYCLMTNHVHLVAVPRKADSLALAVGRADFRYTQYVNRMHSRVGHLWQNRFHSSPLDERHTVAALRYLEQNPVRARIVRVPWRYRWSSASAHVGGRDGSGLLDLDAWGKKWTPDEWREMLRSSLDEKVVESLRHHTARGRPLGSDSFISKLEHLLGRRLRALPIGRPKGWRKKTRAKKKRRKTHK
jgi:putative transposase